jgi:hypothetical protein
MERIMKKWCHNAKTGEIFSYEVSGNLTDFPRGTFLAYNDYLTTGLKTKEAAEEWAKEYGCCNKCKNARPVNENGKCIFCGEKIKFFS